MPLIQILIGAVLLLFGRRLFWLFVAGVGFVVAAQLTADSMKGQPEWLTLALAVGVGVIGALAAVFYQRVLVAISGFFAGGYLLTTLAAAQKYAEFNWVIFLIGGVLGAMLVLALLDWALILLSALLGATVITQNVTLDPQYLTPLFVVLLVVGVIVQARQLRGGSRPKPKREGA